MASRSWIPHLREVSWVAIGQIAAALGALLAIKVCTNVLDPSEFGRFSAALAIAGLAQACLFGPVAQSATRFFSTARDKDMPAVYWSSLIKLYAASVFITVIFGFAAALLGLDSLIPLPASLVIIYTISLGLQTILLAAINAARLRRRLAGLQIFDALLRPTLALAVSLFATHSSSAVLLSYIVTSITIVGAATLLAIPARDRLQLRLRPSFQLIVGTRIAARMWSFSSLFAVFGVLGAIGSHGERLLLIDLVTWKDIGIYALLMQLAMAPNLMMTNLINQYYLPLIFQPDSLSPHEQQRSYRYYLAVSIGGVIAITIFMGVLGQWIVPLFSTTAFLGHEHLLWHLGISAGLFNLGQQLVLPGMRANRLNVYLPSKLLHSAALLCFALLLVPTWGITGMALASMVSAGLYALSIICANFYLARSASPAV